MSSGLAANKHIGHLTPISKKHVVDINKLTGFVSTTILVSSCGINCKQLLIITKIGADLSVSSEFEVKAKNTRLTTKDLNQAIEVYNSL